MSDRVQLHLSHRQVYVSYAKFEADIGEVGRARKTFEKASQQYPSNGDCKDERVMLLESWLQMEQQLGDEKHAEDIEAKMPKRVKKKRPMQSDDQVLSIVLCSQACLMARVSLCGRQSASTAG